MISKTFFNFYKNLAMLNKIEYRLKYRSTREMDLIFGKFWCYFKKNYSKKELIIFKKLIDEDDVDIYNWIIGFSEIPKNYIILIKKIRADLGIEIK